MPVPTPPGLASHAYNLFVSAVGVQSKVAFSFTTGESEEAGPPPDAGPDAAAGSDAGGPADATTGLDATTGTEPDATASGDGEVATGSDATAGADASIGSEAGNGESPDAAQVATMEGGPALDAAPSSFDGDVGDSGTDDVGSPSGCGCRTAGDPSTRVSPVALTALAGLVLISRRRRKSA